MLDAMPLPPRVRPLQGRRVLVVDGEPAAAEDLRHGLEALGAQVIGPTGSVETALRLAQVCVTTGATPNAAIIDFKLGDELACPVIDALRERGVPILVATRQDQLDLPDAYRDVPICRKPVDVERCLHLLFE